MDRARDRVGRAVAIAACALALCAAACAVLRGFEVPAQVTQTLNKWKELEPVLPGRLRRLRLGGGHRLGTLAMALILCRIISLHIVMYRRARAPAGARSSAART